MNSLHPYYAFATISGCGGGCTDSKNFIGGCEYKGIAARSCQEAKDAFNNPNKTGVINTTKPTPATRTVRHQRLPVDAAASIGGSAIIAPLAVSADIGKLDFPKTDNSIQSTIGNAIDIVKNPVDDILNKIGVPPDLFGIPSAFIVGGAMILIFIIAMWR